MKRLRKAMEINKNTNNRNNEKTMKKMLNYNPNLTLIYRY